VKKGDVLFKLDPTPYELTVRALEAQLANTSASARELDEQLSGAIGKVAETRGKVAEAGGAIQQAEARVREIQPKLDLARTRVGQNRELVATGAGDRFSLERAEADLKELEAQLDTARSVLAQARASEAQARAGEVQSVAAERQIRQRIAGKVGNEYAPVAQIRAQLESAKWELSQTTVYAPANGYAINVQLRPGSFTAAFPITPAMTFVEDTYQVIALYQQNELHQVKPGNEAEFTLNAYPGKIIKAKVDSIVWAQGQGQVANSTQLPTTGYGPMPPGRFPVKLTVEEKDAGLFFPAGAVGHGAIYTDSVEAIQILRKVILRIGAKLDYLIPKLH
jgi:multidrug resistance efflux pump